MANPERSTEMLWEPQPEPRRSLNLERIVRAAVELADAEGLAALSMRRLAERLGFTTMALYRHVPGKAELLTLMRERVHGETEADAGPARAAGWRAELEVWARDELAMYRRHPWLAESDDARHVPGPHTVGRFERALEIVARTGLPPAHVVAAVNLVGGFVGSTARQAAAEARMRRRTGVSDEEWWQDRDSLFAHLDRYPTLSRLYREGAYDTPPDPFEFGLQRVLDGVEALVRYESRDEKGCGVCGRPVDRGPAGRPRDYCSPACRQRAYRLRRGQGG
ncbi:TetR/AcrR family transcriptional regulator [Marinitenerispora sediminis]|uniref:TetR family transcriptional regulator n=1 Tax=Marinitenerispora sediminis TaxID=1931232 RepID=A0A368T7D9_9ACTN|nr:TetR/AcrR family transcriptional regulator C-terminal domain-containing protein [Marinitenerispora sediminis]RCV50921.1 TetR family transcriptional regulator [Marinitenerispora sediminis]RCV59719.1 TetR family transcriptional regulator [Marinitenerispora sediminis]RCV59829.1 TetR family transcriptional regulator [Marinitenerispora sediminis]